MASLHGSGTKRCPVCLDAPPVMKVVTTCQHVICRECLVIHLKGLSSGDQNFTCPTCQIVCPLPCQGVDGLENYTGKELTGPVSGREMTTTTQGDIVRQKVPTKRKGRTTHEVEKHDCEICLYSKPAANMAASHKCTNCANLHLCKTCARAHRRERATANHTLVNIEVDSHQPQNNCKEHLDKLITCFCYTCDLPVCPICIHLGHGAHAIKGIDEVHQERLGRVESKKDIQVQRVVELRDFQRETEGYRGRAEERKNRLVTDVEDQAEKCMGEIIKQKETMKKTIDAEFDPIMRVTGCLDTIPALATRLDETVAKVDSLLSDPGPSVSALTELSGLSEVMDEAGKITEKLGREVTIREYQQLWEKLPEFTPSSLQHITLGTLYAKETEVHKAEVDVRDGETVVKRDVNIEEAKLVCENELTEGIFPLRSVTTIGKDYYAINSYYTVSIFRYPGFGHRSLMEHVFSAYMYDIAATPDGNIAVLSSTTARKRAVNLYHRDLGFMISSTILDIEGYSFDVNNKHQYVVLGANGVFNMKVSIFNVDGSPVLTHLLDVETHDIKRQARRISCSARYIYVMASEGFAVYEVRDKQMVHLATSDGGLMRGFDPVMRDISVTSSDQVFYCYHDEEDDGSNYVATGRFESNHLMDISHRTEVSGEYLMRICGSKDHVVYSYASKWRVYEL